MYSFWSRLNAVFTFAVIVLGVSMCLNHLSTYYFFQSTPTGTIRLNEIKRLRPTVSYSGDGVDQANLSLDIDADLRSLWNWNVKVIYVYVTAEYSTKANAVNDITLWDTIVQSEAAALLDYEAVVNEYTLKDRGQHLRNAEVTLHLRYNVMPYMGILKFGELDHTDTFTLPSSYST